MAEQDNTRILRHLNSHVVVNNVYTSRTYAYWQVTWLNQRKITLSVYIDVMLIATLN